MNIDSLYNRYKSSSDERIRKYLDNINIVRKIDNKYFILDDLISVKENPRKISPYFGSRFSKEIKGLSKYKEIQYLVKSSSSFFLKPDIGEIFDQLDDNDLIGISAIDIESDYTEINGTNGEHFILYATLLKKDRESKLKRILYEQ